MSPSQKPLSLTTVNTPARHLQFSNLAYLHQDDINEYLEGFELIRCGKLISKFAAFPGIQRGTIALNKYMRQQSGAELAHESVWEPFKLIRNNNNNTDPSSSSGSAIDNQSNESMVVEIRFLNESAVEKKIVSVPNIIQLIRKCFEGHVFVRSQCIAMVYNGEYISAKISYTSSKMVSISDDLTIYIILSKDNQIMKLANIPYDINTVPKHVTPRLVKKNENSSNQTEEDIENIDEEVDENHEQHDIFNSEFTFETLEIGGLDKELNAIFRRAFASRAYPPDVAEMMGVKHVKGIILYGPPGTGKTLIAKKIGQVLNCKTKEVVNGPEIFDSMVGGSEKKIRELFSEAYREWNDDGKNSQNIHLIIMDEIDAICRKRGSTHDNTGVRDGVVNQLLTMIDGVDTPNNFLVIGMTNRLDMLDPAMLRPGRFEVQIEIGLPNEEGRMQILKIHTAKLLKNNFLANDVDLEILVEKTKNYTGSDIMGVVNSARSFAMNRGIDLKNKKAVANVNFKDYSGQIKITMEDFYKALSESKKPTYGVSVDDLNTYIGKGIIQYGSQFSKLLDKCELLVKQVDKGENTSLASLLLEGDKGCGKTALAVHLALHSKFPYVRVVTPNNMIGMSEFDMCQYVSEAFNDAYKSEKSVIVLDNIERIIQLVRVGPRFSNVMLQTLMTFIAKPPPKNRKLLIIGTTTMLDSLEPLDLVGQFDRLLHVPLVIGSDNIAEVISSSCGDLFVGDAKKSQIFLEALLDNIGERIPIKQLLSIIDIIVANKGVGIEDILELIDLKKKP